MDGGDARPGSEIRAEIVCPLRGRILSRSHFYRFLVIEYPSYLYCACVRSIQARCSESNVRHSLGKDSSCFNNEDFKNKMGQQIE